MNICCLLGFHSWKRVGIVMPIRREGDFSGGSGLCDGHFALGKCRRCSKEEMRQCWGRFSWYRADEITEAEYMEKFESGEYRDIEEAQTNDRHRED